MRRPFPEELNRVVTSRVAEWHFCPTEGAMRNLYNEGIRKNVHMVGNTVIDALLLGIRLIKGRDEEFGARFPYAKGRYILVTGHRRESFGEPFEEMCLAMADIVDAHPDVPIIYPVHLNPNVREPVQRLLGGRKGIHLIDPVDYPGFIWLMSKCYIVLTDSGGVQEEAPSLGKPVLVMRDVTERHEGVEAGTARLVGTSRKRIAEECCGLLEDEASYAAMAKATNPYGDGRASERIADILETMPSL